MTELPVLRVAYQGVEGSYSHLAAQRRYGAGARLEGHDTFAAAARAVRDGAADVALLPVENTTAGSVQEVADLIADLGLSITGEAVSAIEHCLLGVRGARLEDVRMVLSHWQALAQCDAFLRAHPGMAARAEFDTAGAARKVAEARDPALAAIASEAAGRRLGLDVLARDIQTRSGNWTRFVEVSRAPVPPPRGVPCRTALVLVLPHEPGALARALTELARHGVNLTKLESRPLPETPWQYRFHLDLDGSVDDAPVRAALDAVRAMARELRVLGSYAAAPRPGAEGA